MSPLIPIAISLAKEFLPSLVGKVAGDETGSIAGQVIDAASGLVGVKIEDESSAAVALKALKQNPELALNYQKHLADLEHQLELAYLEDIKDARERDAEFIRAGKRNIRADAMVIAAFVAVTVIAVFLINSGNIEEGVLAFLTTIGGMLMKNISTAFDFEFGSSRSSKGKSDDMGALMRELAANKK